MTPQELAAALGMKQEECHVWMICAWEPSIQSTILTLFWLPIGISVAFACMWAIFAFLGRQHGGDLKAHMRIIERDPNALAVYRGQVVLAVLLALAIFLGAIIK